MKMKDFVEAITKEMKEEGWEDLELRFDTPTAKDMGWLSVFKRGGSWGINSVIIDIGYRGGNGM